MRAFIAIELPENIKIKLEETVKVFKKCDLDATWVETKNIHMTLKFLGEVDEEQLEEIKKGITTIANQFKSFTVSLTNFGFFPNEKHPRVFFIATDKEEILKQIADTLEEKLVALGFAQENRFKSHLTLCRFKGTKNIELLKGAIHRTTLEGSFLIEAINLCKSTLTKYGPIYEEIFKASLTA